MAGGEPATFWHATPFEVSLMLEGYARRRLHGLRDLAQHYIWVKALITKKGPQRADQMVRDPDERRIYSSDFDDPDEFRRVLESDYGKGGG